MLLAYYAQLEKSKGRLAEAQEKAEQALGYCGNDSVVSHATIVFGNLNRAPYAFFRPWPSSSAGCHADQMVNAKLPDPLVSLRAAS